MNKIFKLSLFAFVSFTFAFAEGNMDKKPKKMMYQAVPMEKARIIQDGKTKKILSNLWYDITNVL